MVEINFSESQDFFNAIDAEISSDEFSNLSNDEKLGRLRDISQNVGQNVIGLQPNSGGLGTLNGPMDAFQHAFSSGLLVAEYGDFVAELAGLYNERHSIADGDYVAAQMDIFNNWAGRE